MNSLVRSLKENEIFYEKDWIKYYEDYKDFCIDFSFLKKTIFPKAILLEHKKKRLSQQEFRKQLLDRYNNKCIVSGINCIDELEAAHIIPFKEIDNFDIDNGIILTRNLHATFDKYLWSINPITLKIEINNSILAISSSIFKYNNSTIKMDKNSICFIEKHYSVFSIKKNV